MNRQLTKDKNILIVGLGVIGGSYAMALSKKGYSIYGFDNNAETVRYAKENGYIKDGCEYSGEIMKNADIVVISLYPSQIEDYIKAHLCDIKKGAVITDVCGIKRAHTAALQELLEGRAEFIGMHPMAGREVSGISGASAEMFCAANFIVTPTSKNTPAAKKLGEELGAELGCAAISTLTPAEHDRMVGYLSQLAHIIAVSLMTANSEDGLYKFTGDSFRDLTRIAKINAPLWLELFYANKDYLIPEIDSFVEAIQDIKSKLQAGDSEGLIEIFNESTSRRTKFDKPV